MNGSRMKEFRLQKRMSQEHVATEMHVVRQTISKWERDLSSPSSDLLEKLSILGCDLSKVNLSFFLKRYSQSAINHCP